MDPMTEVERPEPPASEETEQPAAQPVGAELLLKSLQQVETALFSMIQHNGKLSSKLGNALRRIEALEQENQYMGLLISNLYHNLEMEVPARPLNILAIEGSLMHPADEGYDATQHGAILIKFHQTPHPVYGQYEVLVTDVENDGSPLARPMETLHPKAQELIAKEFTRLQAEEKFDANVFYGTNFAIKTREVISAESVAVAAPAAAEAPAEVDAGQDVELGAEPAVISETADANDSERS